MSDDSESGPKPINRNVPLDERSVSRSDRESEPDTDALGMAGLHLDDNWAKPPADQAQFNLCLQEWQVGAGEKAGFSLKHMPNDEPDAIKPEQPRAGTTCRRTRDKAQLTVRFQVRSAYSKVQLP